MNFRKTNSIKPLYTTKINIRNGGKMIKNKKIKRKASILSLLFFAIALLGFAIYAMIIYAINGEFITNTVYILGVSIVSLVLIFVVALMVRMKDYGIKMKKESVKVWKNGYWGLIAWVTMLVFLSFLIEVFPRNTSYEGFFAISVFVSLFLCVVYAFVWWNKFSVVFYEKKEEC